jgi:hypothetical protein
VSHAETIDAPWLAAVGRALGGTARVLARTPLAGGYVSASVERIDLDVDGRAIAVVRKRASPVEIAAMRAVAVVPGVDRPRLLAAAGDWIVLPFYDGPGLGPNADVPVEVWAVLGRVHVHWRGKRPRGVPVVDAAWWRRMIAEHTLPAVRGAHARTGDALFAEVAGLLEQWSTDPRLEVALALLPRTLCHGDAHRGNVLLAPDGAVLVDWGNARVAPAGLDLATMRAQGAEPPGWAELSEVERCWAQVQVHVQYMGFAADHLGAARVAEMAETAARALDQLGLALRG